jgi:hypothetical protein
MGKEAMSEQGQQGKASLSGDESKALAKQMVDAFTPRTNREFVGLLLWVARRRPQVFRAWFGPYWWKLLLSLCLAPVFIALGWFLGKSILASVHRIIMAK